MSLTEIRGVWLTTTGSKVFDSRDNIIEAMDFLAATGFNVVFPVVWNKAVTQFPSRVMQQNFGVEINPQYQGRDVLAELIDEAHRVNLKVIPWFEYGFASSYNSNGGMLLAKKPQWAARDCKGNLLNKNGFEWLNTLDSEVQDFVLSLILEVVNNYDVDGIQGDDRLPALPCEGGYDKVTVQRYQQEFGKNPPQNPKDSQWLQWRANILTDFLARLYGEVKAINNNLLVSMAPNIHDWALKEYLQDSQTWLKKGLVDIIHPQIYRRDFNSYKSIIDKLVKEQFTANTRRRLAPGVLIKLGSYNINSGYLTQVIEYNRTCGIQGEVFFFYEGLRDNHNALAKVLRNGYYAQSAAFPSLEDLHGGNGIREEVVVKKKGLFAFFRNWF
ncbi:family 10 glycosylhydrolase [Plectonema cf. radiosum LEGE 06105]|uniref:Family 10 glycosylhydrolase n=1 Tax=Plectonema cf. radiosum LEGE 06105 TaxID=945769 RepID=A0A8J7FCS2_9CYAN|nr:family 10 glycosylhydrolase [Plectonema radiosum]MBE9215484.1 family 10 glycosylhydrolase [Plectonema cf. radiosum LEGE 06105]